MLASSTLARVEQLWLCFSFVVEELRRTMLLMQDWERASVEPNALMSAIWKLLPRFRGYQQHDAHEFMRSLLEQVNSELLALKPSNGCQGNCDANSTIVNELFGGKLQSCVECQVCFSKSKKIDPFLGNYSVLAYNFISSKGSTRLDLVSDVSLDIPCASKDSSASESTLEECLDSFTALEKLGDSEKYFCAKCSKRQPSTKEIFIHTLPKVYM